MSAESSSIQAPGKAAHRIIRSKLIPPELMANALSRERVKELLALTKGARLVLFNAPAGFGKTTAMRHYMATLKERDVATYWLSICPLDNDYNRFMAHLTASFDKPDWQTQQSGIEDLPFSLIERLANFPEPFVLFLDNYEASENNAIDEFMRLILTRLPPHGQIVIASRNAPNLQLSRLRSERKLIEIDQSELRFTADESRAFLVDICKLQLTDDDVERLHEHTEGWPATLWLAASALRGNSNPQAVIDSYSGSSSIVSEYLAEEFISKLPPDIYEFLLKTSILEALNTSLCNQICERDDSERVLEQLTHHNVCIATLSPDQKIYKYHGLFKEFLQEHLQRQYGDDVPSLHTAASAWYDRHGRPVRAVDHAIKSGKLERALKLIYDCCSTMLFTGRFRLLATWLDNYAHERIFEQPELCMAYAWSLTLTQRARETLQLLEKLPGHAKQFAEVEVLEAEVTALKLFSLAMLDRYEEVLALLSSNPPEPARCHVFSQNVLIGTLATIKVASSEFTEASEILADFTDSTPSNDSDFSLVYAMSVEGQMELFSGRVRQAIEHFRTVLSGAASSFGTQSLSKSIAAVHLAEALYETDRLEEADQLITLYLPAIQEYALPDYLIISHIIHSRIAHAQGEVDTAYRRLSELEQIGLQTRIPRISAAATLERARMSILKNDYEFARSYLKRASSSRAWEMLQGLIPPAQDVESLTLCRFRLANESKCTPPLSQELKAEIKHAQSLNRNRRALRYKLMLTRALYLEGQPRLAFRTLHSVLLTAADSNTLRLFLDEGMAVLELLREFRSSRMEGAQTEQEQGVNRFVDAILSRAGIALEAPRENTAVAANVDISARELQVLEQLALGLSNAKIAERLFVTETTVRAHLRKINVKLDTRNRTQAVVVARSLGLIN